MTWKSKFKSFDRFEKFPHSENNMAGYFVEFGIDPIRDL